MLSEELLTELTTICDGAKELAEVGTRSYLPGLKNRTGEHAVSQDALLCLQSRDGYPTRLFLLSRYRGAGIIGYAPPLIEPGIVVLELRKFRPSPSPSLAEHLRALR